MAGLPRLGPCGAAASAAAVVRTVDTAVVHCAVEGCDGRLRVDTRHLANLQAAGWRCPGPHDQDGQEGSYVTARASQAGDGYRRLNTAPGLGE